MRKWRPRAACAVHAARLHPTARPLWHHHSGSPRRRRWPLQLGRQTHCASSHQSATQPSQYVTATLATSYQPYSPPPTLSLPRSEERSSSAVRWMKEGAVVIDVGINPVNDATRKLGYRLVGDVRIPRNSRRRTRRSHYACSWRRRSNDRRNAHEQHTSSPTRWHKTHRRTRQQQAATFDTCRRLRCL